MALADPNNIRAVNATLNKVFSVEQFVTKDGTDLIALIYQLKQKITELESKLGSSGSAKQQDSVDPEKVRELIEEYVSTDDFRGPSGPPGPAGPRGPAGRASLDKLQDIKDVDASGLCDGSILVFRKGKWTVEQLSADEE
jgi:hypothetical protein